MEGKTVLSNEALFLPNNNMSLSGLLPVDEKFLLTNVTMNHNDPTLAVVRFMCETVLTLMVSLLGLAGNTISLGVLYRMKKRKLCSVATLLQILAVVDILILINNCALRPFRYILMNTGYISLHAFMFPVLYASTFTLSFINTWLTVILSWNRYQAVCNPLAVYTHPNYCVGNKNPYSQCVVLVLVALLFNMPRYFESKIKYVEVLQRHSFVTTGLLDDKVYMIAYRFVIFTLFQYVIPIGLLIFFNFKIISSLKNNAMIKGREDSRSSGRIKIFVAGSSQKIAGSDEALKMKKNKKIEKDKKDKAKKSRTRYKSLSESTTTMMTFAPIHPVSGALYEPSPALCQPGEGDLNETNALDTMKDIEEAHCLTMASPSGIEIARGDKSDGKCTKGSNGIAANHTTSNRKQTFRHNAQATAVIAVTRMVLVVVIMSTVCSAFTSLAHILQIIQLTYYPDLDMFRRFYTVISNLLSTINHSFNFVAYCLSSKNFRFIFYSWIQHSSASVCSCLSRNLGRCRRK